MRPRVSRYFEQRPEDILQQVLGVSVVKIIPRKERRTDDYILECPNRPIRLVNLIQSWDLDEPSDVV